VRDDCLIQAEGEERMGSFEVKISNALRARLEQMSGKDVEELAEELLKGYIEDGRRIQIDLQSVAVSWAPDLYDAMVETIGRLGISAYVREAVYKDLRKLEKNLMPPPELKTTRAAGASKRKAKAKAAVPKDRLSVIRHYQIPRQWYERIAARHDYVSRYVKAVVQVDMERRHKTEYTVLRGMGDYISHD